MFVCLDCETEFEEPKTEYENQGEYFGTPAWEAFGVCPSCGSTNYDEARRCDRCGEWTASWHRTLNGVLCDICNDDLFG